MVNLWRNSVTSEIDRNQSCIKLSVKPVCHDKSKHIEIKYDYVRDMVHKEAVRLKYIAIDE